MNEKQLSPEISYSLLRSKFEDLRRGVDNTDYISKEVALIENKEKFKKYLKEKYAYGKKKIINTDKIENEKL